MIYQIFTTTIPLFGICDSEIVSQKPTLYAVYCFFLFLELLGFIYTFTFSILTVKIIYESNEFNRNLINSLALFLCQQIASQIGRLILLLYQSGVLGITGNPLNDLPLLILCSYRLCVMAAYVALIETLILERAIAILCIREYESLKRPWIEWCLHTITFLSQLGGFSIFCYCFTFLSDLTYKILYPFLLLTGTLAFLAFHGITLLHHKWLDFLLNKFELEKYTLSSRYQLEENRRALVLIKKIFFAQFCFGVIAATLFSMPHFFFENGSAEMELGMASLDVLQSLYIIIFHSTFIYIVPSWWEKFKENLRRVFKSQKVDVKMKAIIVGVDQIAHNEAGNVYFDKLQKMWA